jgi:hypothetical protein
MAEAKGQAANKKKGVRVARPSVLVRRVASLVEPEFVTVRVGIQINGHD